MEGSADRLRSEPERVSERLRPGIARLIYGGFFLLVAVILGSSFLANATLQRVERTFREVERVQRASDLSDEIERRASALRLAIHDVAAAPGADVATLRPVVENTAAFLRSAAPDLSAENRDMVEGALERLQRIRADLEPDASQPTKTPDLRALDEEARLIARIANLMNKVAARDTAELSSQLATAMRNANRQSIAIGIVSVFLGGLIALLIVRRTVAPLRAMISAMGQVTAGATTFPTPFLRRRDEIGDIARATEALRNALAQVRVSQAQTQRALLDQQSVEAQYEQLFRQSADGIYQTTPDGRLLRANPALVTMMGYEDQGEMIAALGSNIDSLYIDLDDRERFQRLMATVGTVRNFEYRARRRDGRILWLSDSATAIFDKNKAILRYEGMVRDITDQKAAEDGLAESRRRLREVIDTVPASINVKSRDLRFSIMNRYMASLLGIEPEDAIGRTTGELMARYSRSKSDEFDKEVLQTRKELGYYEDQYADASGTIRHWLTKKIPLLDAGGEVESIVTVALDIGERKRAEAALKDAKEEAEAATEAKSQFLAQMSHEIRTPMNGVLGMLEVLDHTALNDAQRKLVTVVRESATALLRIINDILDLSKLDAQKLELEEVPLSLADILAGVEATLAPEARGKGLAFRVEIAPTVPQRLRGDPIRLRQVLLNLAANAVKFTTSGGVTIAATREMLPRATEEQEKEVALRIAVHDTGIGIEADSVSHLFEPFSQTDTSIARRFGGTGLGLSICKRIVDLMGGSISVESAPGQGSTFMVDLKMPLAEAESAPEDLRVAKSEPPHANVDAGQRAGQILVADDHPTNLEVIQRQLAILGYSADAVVDGQQAYEAVRAKEYALLLTDCHMPVMDGFELTAKIRAQEAGTSRRLPIVAITANALVGESERCVAAGMDDYLAKPVGIAQLRAMLLRFLPDSPIEQPPGASSSPASKAHLVALDLAAMSALFDDDQAAIRRTLGKFVDFAQGSVKTLHNTARERDWEGTKREADRLASASATVGAQALSSVGRSIGASATHGDSTSLMAQLGDLDRAIENLSGAVQAL